MDWSAQKYALPHLLLSRNGCDITSVGWYGNTSPHTIPTKSGGTQRPYSISLCNPYLDPPNSSKTPALSSFCLRIGSLDAVKPVFRFLALLVWPSEPLSPIIGAIYGANIPCKMPRGPGHAVKNMLLIVLAFFCGCLTLHMLKKPPPPPLLDADHPWYAQQCPLARSPASRAVTSILL